MHGTAWYLETPQPRPYLAEGRTLGHDDLELALASSFLQKGLNSAGVANGHDHLVGVDVLQRLHGNVVSGALCNRRNTTVQAASKTVLQQDHFSLKQSYEHW